MLDECWSRTLVQQTAGVASTLHHARCENRSFCPSRQVLYSLCVCDVIIHAPSSTSNTAVCVHKLSNEPLYVPLIDSDKKRKGRRLPKITQQDQQKTFRNTMKKLVITDRHSNPLILLKRNLYTGLPVQETDANAGECSKNV